MGFRRIGPLAIALAGCTPDPAPVAAEPQSDAGLDPGSLPPLASLSLRAELAVASPIEAGQPVRVEAKIVNVSPEPLPVVAPGDGSELGWREPHVFFRARHHDKGATRAVSEVDYTRCGMYDENWGEDVKLLAPGASLELALSSGAEQFLDLQTPGKHELVVHYRYTQGHTKKAHRAIPSSMAQVPAFEIVSNPVVFEITRPLEVRLKAIGSLQKGKAKPIDDVFRVVVHNHDRTPREIRSPTRGDDAQLLFRVESDHAARPSLDDGDGPTPTKTVAPGDSAVVLGTGSIFDPSGSTWTVDRAGQVRVQVEYQQIRSNWITVVVR